MEEGKQFKVIIIGGGLIGPLSACYFAKHGHEVHLYEYRKDIRTTETVQGRSINLLITPRSRSALRKVGLEDIVLSPGIPIKERAFHTTDGSVMSIVHDAEEEYRIYSLNRRKLHEELLTAAEAFSNVKIYFEYKLINAQLEIGSATFQRINLDNEHTDQADLIVGADGAYSAVRSQFMKLPMFNFSQSYIEYGYVELRIPPTPHGQSALRTNAMHFWLRDSTIMMGFPNRDHSWNIILAMSLAQFGSIDSPRALLDFFQKHYPASISLFGKDKLVQDYFAVKPSHLVTAKCDPCNLGSNAVLIGDAAHTMLPFFGQGVNVGFEDCELLDQMLTECDWDLQSALTKFSQHRSPDIEAACDMSFQSYFEIFHLMSNRSYLWRNKLDYVLSRLVPNLWVPLYNSVMFSCERYSVCARINQRQDKQAMLPSSALE